MSDQQTLTKLSPPPNWQHPKIQALIGADARNRIVIDLIWRILENPNRDDFTAMDMEYWDSIHDAVKTAVVTPEQPKPLTNDQVWENAEIMALNGEKFGVFMEDLMKLVRAIERAHGIN